MGKKENMLWKNVLCVKKKSDLRELVVTTLQSVVHATKIRQIKDLHFMVLLRTKMAMKYVFVRIALLTPSVTY